MAPLAHARTTEGFGEPIGEGGKDLAENLRKRLFDFYYIRWISVGYPFIYIRFILNNSIVVIYIFFNMKYYKIL